VEAFLLSETLVLKPVRYNDNNKIFTSVYRPTRCLQRKKKVFRLFNYKRDQAWAENIYIVTQLGLTMAGCIAFCFFIGLYLDKWLGTKGVFTTIFIILGVIGGGNTVYRQILEITEQNEKDPSSTDNGSG